jgi:hypothetical protein
MAKVNEKMIDFRKITSPKSQAERARENAEMLSFQELDPTSMAERMLGFSRCLQDSGCFEADQRYSYDEWAIYRVVPALARRLDPDVALRKTEIPEDIERNDPITWLEDATDEKLLGTISSIVSHGSFLRAKRPDTDPEVKAAAEILFGQGVSLLTIATDTALPGSYPARCSPDTRVPLEGLYVIEVTKSGRHRVLEYSENPSVIDRTYDVAVAMQKGEEIPEQDLEIMNRLRRWGTVQPVEAIQIQDFSGEVLREYGLIADPEDELDM